MPAWAAASRGEPSPGPAEACPRDRPPPGRPPIVSLRHSMRVCSVRTRPTRSKDLGTHTGVLPARGAFLFKLACGVASAKSKNTNAQAWALGAGASSSKLKANDTLGALGAPGLPLLRLAAL